jgi:hypothetical protein
MAQRTTECKMETTCYKRFHAEGRKTRRGGMGREGENWRRLAVEQYIQSAKKVGGKREGQKRRMRRRKVF